MIVEPFEEIADPSREDNQKMVDVLIRDGTDGQIVQNRIEDKVVIVGSTDHGWTLITFTIDWQEHYHIVGNSANFTKRQGYVIAGSSRAITDTPYTVALSGKRHETSSGSVLRASISSIII